MFLYHFNKVKMCFFEAVNIFFLNVMLCCFNYIFVCILVLMFINHWFDTQ